MALKINFKNSTAVSLSRSHDPVTQDNPQTSLEAVQLQLATLFVLEGHLKMKKKDLDTKYERGGGVMSSFCNVS